MLKGFNNVSRLAHVINNVTHTPLASAIRVFLLFPKTPLCLVVSLDMQMVHLLHKLWEVAVEQVVSHNQVSLRACEIHVPQRHVFVVVCATVKKTSRVEEGKPIDSELLTQNVKYLKIFVRMYTQMCLAILPCT